MMGHLNRLRNWWRDACIRFRNQSSADPSAAYDIVVEDPGRHEVAVPVPLTESESSAPGRPAGEQTEPIKSSVPDHIQEVSLPAPNITSPPTTFTDPEYVITSGDPLENIWTPEELGLEQEMLVEPPPPGFARFSHKDSHSQPEAETNVAVQLVAPPVQLEAEPEVQPVAPPVQLEAEPEVQPVAPSVQLKAEPEVQPVAPSLQLEAEPEVQPIAPPVQLKAEPEVQPVAPPVQLEPPGPVAQEPIVKSLCAQPQTDLRVTETVPKHQTNENRSPENASAQLGKPVKAETAKKQSKKKSKNSKVEVKVEEPKKPATVDTGESSKAGSAIRVGRDKYSPGTVTDETAQRLARLLISEIKLYNKVDTDSATNNVYDVLKDPIDKARKYYGQRLGTAAIASMPDYFHAELVRTLCAGDASRLGPNYHGLKKETIQEELVESL